jgi:GT2 family glycosyltransferase
MSLAAIVPVWNGRPLLARLLATLDAQTHPASEVVVVDNGSTDGAPELARERGARVISMGRNAGFAPAVNRAIRESRSDWVAVLNSDVELAPDYFTHLCAAGSEFATGKILMRDAPTRIDATFDVVCRGGVAWRVGHGCADGPAFSTRRAIWSPPWTAALFRRTLFDRVGVLDETFESYLEDVEFGIRCALHGVSGLYVPEAVAWHQGSASLGRWHPEMVRLISRNQCYLVARHYPARYAWPILVAQGLWGLLAARHGAGGAWLRGKWQGMRTAGELTQNPKARNEDLFKHCILQGEKLIRELQEEVGADAFWRLYFLLAPSVA